MCYNKMNLSKKEILWQLLYLILRDIKGFAEIF